MKPLIIFDIDGVLANIDRRAAYIECDKPDWEKFYNKHEIAKDLPVKPMIAIYNHFLQTAEVEIWTGRQKSTELITRQWLQKHTAGLPSALRMRPNDNRMTNLDLKREFMAHSKRKPAMAFDAQPKTAELWHARGVQVCYCVHPYVKEEA